MQPESSKDVVVVEETESIKEVVVVEDTESLKEVVVEEKIDETQEEEIYQQIYYEYDTELYGNGNGEGFSTEEQEWQLKLDEEALREVLAEEARAKKLKEIALKKVRDHHLMLLEIGMNLYESDSDSDYYTD